MDPEWYLLPDGSEVNIPNDASPAQLRGIFDHLSTEFPDSIGTAWSSYNQPGQARPEEDDDKGNIFGALYQALENIPRGAASVPLMGATGIAGLLTPHKDTAIEKQLRGARDWLYSGIAPEYQDSKIAGIGLGLGQIGPLILGGMAMARAGLGAAVPGFVSNTLGIPMTSRAMTLLGGAQGVQSIAAGSLMSIPMHWGQWTAGVADFEERTGQNVSALRELAGFAPATLLGIGEMLPLAAMPGIGPKATQLAGMIGGGAAPRSALAMAQSFITGATTEAIQESTAELGQIAMARALYDDEAMDEMGSRIWDAGIIGGGAGGIASVLMNLAIRGAKGGDFARSLRREESLQREYNRNRRSMADPMDRVPVVEQEPMEGPGFDPGSATPEQLQERRSRITDGFYDKLKAQEIERARAEQEAVAAETEQVQDASQSWRDPAPGAQNEGFEVPIEHPVANMDIPRNSGVIVPKSTDEQGNKTARLELRPENESWLDENGNRKTRKDFDSDADYQKFLELTAAWDARRETGKQILASVWEDIGGDPPAPPATLGREAVAAETEEDLDANRRERLRAKLVEDEATRAEKLEQAQQEAEEFKAVDAAFRVGDVIITAPRKPGETGVRTHIVVEGLVEEINPEVWADAREDARSRGFTRADDPTSTRGPDREDGFVDDAGNFFTHEELSDPVAMIEQLESVLAEVTQEDRRQYIIQEIARHSQRTPSFVWEAALFDDQGRMSGGRTLWRTEAFVPLTTEEFNAEVERRFVESKANEELEASVQPSATLGQEEQLELLAQVGRQQLGAPEALMREYQEVYGSGLMSGMLEHVGDLPNRISPVGRVGVGPLSNFVDIDSVLEKINKALQYLEQGYGFRATREEKSRWAREPTADVEGEYTKEYQDYIDSGRGFALEVAEQDAGQAPEQRERGADVLRQYAEAHAQLPAYNEAQRLAIAAPVALAEGRYGDAISALRQLRDLIESRPVPQRESVGLEFTPESPATQEDVIDAFRMQKAEYIAYAENNPDLAATVEANVLWLDQRITEARAQLEASVQPFTPRSEEELRAEAERVADVEIERLAQRSLNAEQKEVEQRQDSGVPLIVLDELSGRTAESIAQLAVDGNLEPETYLSLLISDRLSTVGGESRNELKVFADRNAATNNRYNAGTVAAAILGGDPEIMPGSELAQEIFGDQLTVKERQEAAVRTLAVDTRLPFTRQLLETNQEITPEQINAIIEEASKNIPDFDANYVDDLIWGEEGNVSMYDRVQRTLQDREVEWRETTGTGQVVRNPASHRKIGDPFPQSLQEVLDTNDTLRVDDVEMLNYGEGADPPLRTIYIVATPYPDTANQLAGKYPVFWAAKPGTTQGMEHNFREGEASVENGKIVEIEYQYNKLVYGKWKRIRQSWGVLTDIPVSQVQAAAREAPALELRLSDPVEQDATNFVRQTVAEATDKDTWKSHSRFVEPLQKLIKKQNLKLHSDSNTGTTGLKSDGFRALVKAVTGQSDIENRSVRPGQRKALFGHIASMPAFKTVTLLPDLSRPTYTGEQAARVLVQLEAARNARTRKGPAWVEMEEFVNAADPKQLTDMEEAEQLARHFVEAGYITARKRRGKGGQQTLHVSLNDDTRPASVPPTDATIDEERRVAEAKAAKQANTERLLLERIEDVKTAVELHLRRMGLPGLEYQLAADIDPIYKAILGSEGVVENPTELAKSLAMLDRSGGPNTRLWINLSQIDPDGTRKIPDIINDINEEVIHAYDEVGYWFENEIRTMNSRALETVVPEIVSEEGNRQGLTFVEFTKKLYPDINELDLMAEARAKYMTALAKNQLPLKKTAGKVRTLKEKLVDFLTAGIESGRDTGMQDVLSILGQFKAGTIGRRGKPLPGAPRSMRLSQYADPRHMADLQTAIERGDTQLEQDIAEDVVEAKPYVPRYASKEHIKALEDALAKNDTEREAQILSEMAQERELLRAQAAPPEMSWRERLENRFLVEEELANRALGEIPVINESASEAAIGEYFRQKKGGDPYTMPEAVKHKFRNMETWAPSQKLQELYDNRAPDVAADEQLVGEILIDALQAIQDPVNRVSENKKAWDKLTPQKQQAEITKVYQSFADAWKKPFDGTVGKDMRLESLRRYIRRRVADGAYPVEELQQLVQKVQEGHRQLAETSAITALRWRNSAGNVFDSAYHLGGIEWVGTPEDGSLRTITYGPERTTLKQMFGLLATKQDRVAQTQYLAAKRFIDFNTQKVVAERFLQEAIRTNNHADITFFTQQVKRRIYKKDLTVAEELALANDIKTQLEAERHEVVEFAEAYGAHNQENLDAALKAGLITPAMREFLKNITYLPMYKDIGMMPAFPLGGTGRKRDYMEKWLQFGRMVESKGTLFDHALDSFDNLENMDLVRNILYSENAMIRDLLTNVGAVRARRDAQALEDAGLGVQSIKMELKLDKKGRQIPPEPEADVLRVMVNGQAEYYKMSDPLLTNSIMMVGFSGTNAWLQAMRASGQLLRIGVINFPAFIYKNFARDAPNTQIIAGGAQTGTLGAFFPLLNSIRIATQSGALTRAREAMLVSGGGGMYYSPQDLISGRGIFSEIIESDTPLGKGLRALGIGDIGTRMARRARQEAAYADIAAELEGGKVPFRSVSDYAGFIATAYRNIRDLGEATARLGVHDITLAETGNPWQAGTDGLEVMNFGRRGDSPLLNAIIAGVPFLSGGITGLDTFGRSHFGSPDAVQSHLIDSRLNPEAASAIRNRTLIRGMQVAATVFVYYMMMRDEEPYKRAGEVEKMNNYLIPIGDKYFKIPIGWQAGMFYKAMPEAMLRLADEEDYTWGDFGAEFADQTRRNLEFHVAPQLVRPLWNAMRNENEFTRESIVPSFMEDLPPEYQRTEYTSNSAAMMAKMFDVIPGLKTLSSPMKMEYLIRQYLGNAGMYMMLGTDRIVRGYTGQNVIGTRYDWTPTSLFTGEGIENVPILGDVIGDWREGTGSVDEFYKLKDEVDVYVSVLNKLGREGSPDEVQDWIDKNIETQNYRAKINSYGRYMTNWRQRRDNILRNEWMADDRKREIMSDLIEERERVLDGLTSVKLGMRGRGPYTERPAIRAPTPIVADIYGSP